MERNLSEKYRERERQKCCEMKRSNSKKKKKKLYIFPGKPVISFEQKKSVKQTRNMK